MTPIMPTSVITLTSMPSSAELMKSWTASMSLVTRVIRSPLRVWSCSARDSRWMWWYSVRRRSCPTHWLTLVVRYFSK